MFGNLTGWHALILLVVIVLLFGATKLPALAKGVGQSLKIFKNEMKEPETKNPNAPDDDAGDASTKPKQ
jgi:sec-independent protein translocase protein TatA